MNCPEWLVSGGSCAMKSPPLNLMGTHVPAWIACMYLVCAYRRVTLLSASASDGGDDGGDDGDALAVLRLGVTQIWERSQKLCQCASCPRRESPRALFRTWAA